MSKSQIFALFALIAGPIVIITACVQPPQAPQERFDVVEAGIPEIQRALAEGRVTSRQLVDRYLERIGLYELDLNATMAVNPQAQVLADDSLRRRMVAAGLRRAEKLTWERMVEGTTETYRRALGEE